MDATLPKPDWHEITEKTGIDELMDHFGHFHDGCVREFHIETGHFVGEDLSMTCGWRTTVHLHLQVQRQRRDPSAIEMRFEEVVDIRICPPLRGWVSIIFEAAFFLHEGVF